MPISLSGNLLSELNPLVSPSLLPSGRGPGWGQESAIWLDGISAKLRLVYYFNLHSVIPTGEACRHQLPVAAYKKVSTERDAGKAMGRNTVNIATSPFTRLG